MMRPEEGSLVDLFCIQARYLHVLVTDLKAIVQLIAIHVNVLKKEKRIEGKKGGKVKRTMKCPELCNIS